MGTERRPETKNQGSHHGMLPAALARKSRLPVGTSWYQMQKDPAISSCRSMYTLYLFVRHCFLDQTNHKLGATSYLLLHSQSGIWP